MAAAAAHPTRDRGPAHRAGDPPALHTPAHLVPRPPLVVSELDVVRWPAAPSRRRCPSTSTPMAGRACRLSPSPRTSSTRTSAADEQYRSQPSGRPLRLDVRAEISSGDRDPGLGQPPTSFSNGRRGCPGATTPPAPTSSGSVSTAIRRPVSSGLPGPDETYESTGVAHSVPRPSPDLARRPAPPPAARRRRPSTSSRCWPLRTEPADHAVVVAHRPAGLTPADHSFTRGAHARRGRCESSPCASAQGPRRPTVGFARGRRFGGSQRLGRSRIEPRDVHTTASRLPVEEA
jgi:hypothetical protein